MQLSQNSFSIYCLKLAAGSNAFPITKSSQNHVFGMNIFAMKKLPRKPIFIYLVTVGKLSDFSVNFKAAKK
jgi:hypothetical protein